jgi:hypothetical protein
MSRPVRHFPKITLMTGTSAPQGVQSLRLHNGQPKDYTIALEEPYFQQVRWSSTGLSE